MTDLYPCIGCASAFVAVPEDRTKPVLGPYYCRSGAFHDELLQYVKEDLGGGYYLMSLQDDAKDHDKWVGRQRHVPLPARPLD